MTITLEVTALSNQLPGHCWPLQHTVALGADPPWAGSAYLFVTRLRLLPHSALGAMLSTLHHHSDYVTCLAASPVRNVVATAGLRGEVFLIDLAVSLREAVGSRYRQVMHSAQIKPMLG